MTGSIVSTRDTHARSALDQNDAGFTLAEALVALFVFGLISAMILGVLTMQARAEGTLFGRMEAADGVVLAQNALRQRISGMRMIPDTRGTADTVLFTGLPNQLEFVAPTFQADGPHALHRFLVNVTQGRNLVLSAVNERTSPRAAVLEGIGRRQLILLNNVARVDIDYYGPGKFVQYDSWQQSWLRRGSLPKLIRIRVTFGLGDSRTWPVLMVRPAPMTRVPCRDEIGSKNCGENP